MMIKKRTLPMYILLNCLTLGVYGFIVAMQMDKEINALCRGDKQQPGVKYIVAWLISKLPIVGQVYYAYWWYQQANRLKLNANRYGITVKESGTEVFMMRTVMELPLIVFSVLAFAAALLAPGLIVLLFVLCEAYVVGVIVLVLAILTLFLFWNELTAGAVFSVYYIMKNLNRYADNNVGAAEFDPMAYEYYPCVAVKYPQMVNKQEVPKSDRGDDGVQMTDIGVDINVIPPVAPQIGILLGEKGSCAGYKYDLNHGEEIIIGKDAKVSHVVIDPAYKEISRKHVGVTYDVNRDMYRVVDYSSNGTEANGRQLSPGQPEWMPRGTVLTLAKGKNKFLLG